MMGIVIAGLVLFVIGNFIVYGLKLIVNGFSLSEKVKCKFENELTPEQIKEYKMNKANVFVKLIGFSVLVPGLLVVFIVLK